MSTLKYNLIYSRKSGIALDAQFPQFSLHYWWERSAQNYIEIRI
jgi:hypothetical protein